MVAIEMFSNQRSRQVGVKGLSFGVAALAGPHQVDRPGVPLDLLGV
ncbi:hypothetical protein [Aeromicrobium sp. UC242_57]